MARKGKRLKMGERQGSYERLKPGQRRAKTLEECLKDLKHAIERGAKSYRKSRRRVEADLVE